MSLGHGKATGTRGDGTGGPSPTLPGLYDIAWLIEQLAHQLAARREAAARLAPLDDGHRDPLDRLRLSAAEPCSRGFACLAQSIEVLVRAHHCPCVEARKAVEGLAE